MSRCLDCTSLTSHSKKLAVQGWGNCKSRPEWKYLSITYDRECGQFAQVTPDVAKTRAEWTVKVGAA